MAEYIEREALIKAVAESLKNNPHKDAKVSVNHITEHQYFAKLIERQPAADVAPVVHGNWSLRGDREENPELAEILETFYLECSVCRRKVTDIDQGKAWTDQWMELIRPYPYCHCGAKMHTQAEEQYYIDHGYMEPKQIDMWGEEDDGR